MAGEKAYLPTTSSRTRPDSSTNTIPLPTPSTQVSKPHPTKPLLNTSNLPSFLPLQIRETPFPPFLDTSRRIAGQRALRLRQTQTQTQTPGTTVRAMDWRIGLARMGG
ncbi:hypothetical protein B5807_03006 [Epicoccum nigrum]|uniref:Uncharacterized protein n=1 Tax=Epicoccum nigrum TaxID=105696 RepID=A0A1Y2M916_EPING|nr:hypothetical protein B5807_03006 [Epicoccum nigrum]